MTEPRRGRKQHHKVVLQPDQDVDDVADVWPGDTLELSFTHTPELTFFMRRTGEGDYEFC